MKLPEPEARKYADEIAKGCAGAAERFIRVSAKTGQGIEDLLGLKAHGLGDDILVALIQTDGSEFHLTAADIIALWKDGLSETVIRAMIETARRAPAPDAAVMPAGADGQVPADAVFEAPDPMVEVPAVEPVDTEPAAVVVPVPVPVVVPVAVPAGYRHKPDPPSPVYW